jgi:hypothetical protein
MGAFYLIEAYRESDERGPKAELLMNSAQFEAALRARWTDVTIFDNPVMANHWEITIGKDPQPEMVFLTDQMVGIEKPGEHNLIEFAIWYRSLFPAEYKMLVFNDADSDTYELRPDTTYVQAVKWFGNANYVPTIQLSSQPDLQALERHLREQWPGVTVYPIVEADPYLFYWELVDKVEFNFQQPVEDDYGIQSWKGEVLQSGAVDRENPNHILLSYYPISATAQFALWYRRTMPPDTDMTIFIPAGNNGISVKKSTTEAEIVTALKADWEAN